MAIKPNFLTSMGYHIFLTMVLRARAPKARAELPYEDEPLADSEADAGYEREFAAKLTRDTKGKLHAVSSWLV